MFTSKSGIILSIISSFFLFSNCSELADPFISSSELIPLKKGNSWNYKFTSYDSIGVISYTENQISTIIKDTILFNQTWFTYSDVPHGIWYTNKTDGYWGFVEANTGSTLNDTSFIVFLFPAKVGDIYGDSNSPIEVLAIDEELTVPAGIFNTIHYHITYLTSNNYLDDSFEIYIAPEVGVIKRMQIGKKFDGTKFLVFKTELVNYSLN